MIDYTIFVIDDEPVIRDGITISLKNKYSIKAFPDAESAIEALKHSPPDLILLDIGLPGIDGIEALREIKKIHPDILVIMITAFEDIQMVISSMKLGAYDYVVKPLHMDGLEVSIGNALETIRLRKEVKRLQEAYLKENIPCFIGESRVVQDLMDFIKIIAKSPDTPVLIQGETGTGKELIAGAIHYRSPNFKGPLITINCAGIPKNLVESELFGYEKGAFSGASINGKKGLIEEAAKGTLFLDEVGDLSLEAQAKLLRFIEEGEFYRIGGTKIHQVKTRIISATNKILDNMIHEGQFRKDLYFRLGVVKVQIPSLNERKDDIVPISRYFLFEFNKKFKKKIVGISPLAEKELMNYDWPGNVRELKNIIERASLICRGSEITEKDLNFQTRHQSHQPYESKEGISFSPLTAAGINFPSVQNSLEEFYIKQALILCRDNEVNAAKLLGINHHTFRYRRKKLGIIKGTA